eukprot:SAG31_NODE_46335_length_255_cov_0.621795_1_plen_22_part_10
MSPLVLEMVMTSTALTLIELQT